MANPQLEDGFMRVANGIVDNICKLSLNGTEQKVIWCVIRYTYGFNRRSHCLSASFISQWANCDISSVKRALRHLQKMNIIVCINADKRGVTAELKFNKNYDQWKLTGGRNDTSVTNDTGGKIATELVAETPPELVAELPHKKRQIEKTNIKTKYYDRVNEILGIGKSAESKNIEQYYIKKIKTTASIIKKNDNDIYYVFDYDGIIYYGEIVDPNDSVRLAKNIFDSLKY